jgi:hypothetical protein
MAMIVSTKKASQDVCISRKMDKHNNSNNNKKNSNNDSMEY